MRVRADWPLDKEKCKIAFVGEAPGREEEEKGRPFIGRAGWLFNQMLSGVGINRKDCLVTNVFQDRPGYDNNVGRFFVKKLEARKLTVTSDSGEQVQFKSEFPFNTNGFLRPERESEVIRLWDELEKVNPNIVVALGATALWALTGHNKIGDYRGSVVRASDNLLPSKYVKGRQFKVIPTYHPAAVLRNWQYKPIVMADLQKAIREAQTKDKEYPDRQVWIYPTIDDMFLFQEKYIDNAKELSYDIETGFGMITCVGFAPNPFVSISIPFFDISAPDYNYWKTLKEEVQARRIIQHWLSDTKTTKIAQNGTYDIMWLDRDLTKVRGPIEDTMIMHHALQPELPKGLGFLGSLYADEQAWKMLGKRKAKSEKQDE